MVYKVDVPVAASMSVTDRDVGGEAGQVHGDAELVAIVDEGADGTVCTIAPAVTRTDDEVMARWISADDGAFVDLDEVA